MFQKILLGIALLCVAALGFIAISETKRANYWQNFRRTEPARGARWNGRGKEPDPEEETEIEKQPEGKLSEDQIINA